MSFGKLAGARGFHVLEGLVYCTVESTIKLIFTEGDINISVALKGPHAMIAQYTCNQKQFDSIPPALYKLRKVTRIVGNEVYVQCLLLLI